MQRRKLRVKAAPSARVSSEILGKLVRSVMMEKPLAPGPAYHRSRLFKPRRHDSTAAFCRDVIISNWINRAVVALLAAGVAIATGFLRKTRP
jgi:hypothetical protein